MLCLTRIDAFSHETFSFLSLNSLREKHFRLQILHLFSHFNTCYLESSISLKKIFKIRSISMFFFFLFLYSSTEPASRGAFLLPPQGRKSKW